jgi:adenine-specific DNA-methyltransferase
VELEALDTRESRKARGAFFTPPAMAQFIADWAVRTAEDVTMEPSCGEASFVLACAERLRLLGAEGTLEDKLHGVELHAASAAYANQLLAEAGVAARVHVGDFFDVPLDESYDVVVGNPPYVRYQEFTGASRLKARQAALEVGVSLSGLASSWAAFTVQAARLVRSDGRLGLVLPAELLSVNYAGPVRRFLMERFACVRLFMFDERVFPGATEEVVLLLAEGEGPTDHIAVSQARNLEDLNHLSDLRWQPADPSRKWTPALLDADALGTYSALSTKFVDLESWGRTDLGMVTGNNRYFTLNQDQVEALGLDLDVVRISPPGSKHLRGLRLTDTTLDQLGDEGKSVFLFRPGDKPTHHALSYIRAGQAKRVDKAYKCKVRTPWWRVPWVEVPDLFLTYMNHDTPRLVTNDAEVSYLNSVHGVRLKPENREIGRELLPLASLNSLTVLGAELVGRTYGGGLLKVEPREADRLPVPSPEVVAQAAEGLRAAAAPVGLLLQRGKLLEAVRLIDQVLLVDCLGIPIDQLVQLREARQGLFGRRVSRSGK